MQLLIERQVEEIQTVVFEKINITDHSFLQLMEFSTEPDSFAWKKFDVSFNDYAQNWSIGYFFAEVQ